MIFKKFMCSFTVLIQDVTYLALKGTVSQDFLLLAFFMNQFPPPPRSVLLGPFRIFSKTRGEIRSSMLTTGVADTGGK